MSTRNPNRLTPFFAVVALFVSVVLPLRAHQLDSAAVSSSALAPTAVTATGTVAELIVQNQITGVTLRYLALRLDEGQTVALAGAGLASLANGARVEATGSMTSNVLAVSTFSVLPATEAARKASLATQERKQLQGTLVIFHKDYFAQGRGEYGLGVYDGAKRMTPLNVPVIPDAVHPGMVVNVSGTTAADGTALDTNQITILGLQPADAGPAEAPVTNNVLVMPIKFSDSPAGDPFTGAAVDQAWRTNPRSVAAYYNEVSYGQEQLNVTVACTTVPTPAGCAGNSSSGGWLVSSSPTPANCDFNAIGNLADQVATAAGYNIANYQNRFYVMPNISCGWAGLAYIGYPYQAWSDAVNELWVYGHELGHNFNLYHAGSVSCSPQVFGGSCSVAEYGDRFDVMGNNANNNEQMHFNAAQKSILHWLPASTVVTHTSGTATYTLSPLESAGQTTYAVKIPVANDSNRTYWIEYRQPIGFDSGIAAYPNNGAQIRVASPFDYPCSGCGGDDTELLDMTPTSSGGFYDAALIAGQTYTDSTNGISVTVNSATATALSITVSMGGTATTTLTSSANPSQVGVSVTFTATVAGSAPTGSVGFTADGVTLSGCGALVLPTGSSNSKTVTCGATSLIAGTHSIVATYSGDAANSASTSAALSEVVNPVGAPGSLVNPSFEIPALSGGYQYNPSASGIGWIFASGSGIQGNGSPWGAAAAPSGSQTAFVQGTGSISQTLNLNAGGYTLSFQAARRACCVSPFVQPIQVSVDGIPVGGLVSPASTSFSGVSIPISIATTGAHTITFAGTDPSDKTAFIDAVTLTAASGASTTTLTSSSNPSPVGASVTLTAMVTGSAPTGSVGVTADGATISGCSAMLLPTGSANSKTATCSTTSLAVGTHSIVATYSGDSGNSGSTSSALSQVVNAGGGTDVVWVEDNVPAGATATSDGGDVWNWISSNPAPYAGTLAHQSVVANGEHQHYFYNATATFAVASGDTLFAYVYLDPANLPSEVMLQWNDGSWEHRAYWGANLIAWGTDGTVSRQSMGALPAAGQWVRLAVPAAQVGLVGSTLNGMAYTLYGGRATWDHAGKTGGGGGATATTTTLGSSPNPSTVGSSVVFTATINGSAPTGTVAFTADSTPISGCSAIAFSGGTVNAPTATCSTSGLTQGTHSIVATYSGDSGNSGSSSTALSQVVNVVWVEDSVPAGATATSDGGDVWNWISSNPAPYAGALAHQSVVAGGEHQHYFYNATATFAVASGDTLFAYVYLDPANLPSEVMLQWNDGSWEHRAYWGSNLIGWGTDGTVSRQYMGALPAVGQWVRLAVPAAQVGLEGHTLNGMAYTLYGGRATWDHAGK